MTQQTRQIQFIKIRSYSLVGILAVLLLGVSFNKARSDEEAQISSKNFEHSMQLESTPLKNFLNYQDSGFGTFYKVSVKTGDIEGKSSSAYEDLFVCSKLGDRPALLACHRQAELQIKKPDDQKEDNRVAVQLKFSEKSSDEEVRAVAWTIPTLLLELYLKGNTPCIFVPAASFEPFQRSMTDQGFKSAAQVGSRSTNFITLQIRTVPESVTVSMCYSPSLKN